MKKLIVATITAAILLTTPIFAADNATLTEADRQAVQEVIDFLDKTPAEIKKEVKEYRKQYRELMQESQALYESLSNDGKQFLKTERERKNKLSPTAKKELKKYISDHKE